MSTPAFIQRASTIGSLLILFVAGCGGDDPPAAASPPTTTAAVPSVPIQQVVPTRRAVALADTAAPTERAFTPTADSLALLPFDVRLNRLADVTGVATSDAMFADLRTNRLALGAHDFGAHVAPDLNWTSQRMSTWVQSLFKVCDDPRMKTRYPNWRDGLERFSRAGWGRGATDEDKLTIDAIATAAGTSATAQWRSTCLALLSSTELVTQ